MENKKFIYILSRVTVISLIFTIYFGSDIDFGKIKHIEFSYIHFKGILFNLSTGVLSSTILLWGFDYINRENIEKEKKFRLDIVYKKIIPILNDYYEFYLNLYKASRNTEVKEGEKVLFSLYECKDEFIKQILITDPFYKDSYIVKKTDMKFDELPDEMCTWLECNLYNLTVCDKKIKNIIELYHFILPVDLFHIMDDFHKSVISRKRLLEYFNFIANDNLEIQEFQKVCVTILAFPEHFLESLKLVENCLEYIGEETNENLLKRELEFFNNKNIRPFIGDLYKKY